jgi:two-component system LytT family response regulator
VNVRVAVIDDEELSRGRMLRLLQAEPMVADVIECAMGEAAVDVIVDQKPHLVFLDVQMPGMCGFKVIEAVGKDRMPPVVLTAAHRQYSVRAFEYEVADYLLKPFSAERFNDAFYRAVAQAKGGEDREDADPGGPILQRIAAKQDKLEHLLLHPEETYVQRFLLKTEGRMVFVRSTEVAYFEAEGNYIRAHIGRESYVIRQTMHELEARLAPERFVRIHRATIVNMDHVKEMQAWFGGSYKVVLCDGTELSLSRGYRQKMEERFGWYQHPRGKQAEA